MNQNIIKDNYDTELLWTDTYKIITDNKNFDANKISTFLEWLYKWNIVFSIIPFSHKLIEYMQEKDFIFKSIRSYYKLNIKKYTTSEINNSNIHFINDKLNFKFLDKDILKLSNTIWETSRFFHDKLISRNKSELIYKTWISNILSRKYWDWWYVLIKNNKIAWIISLNIKGNVGYIDLLGVTEDFQWKWYWKDLLLKWIIFLLSKKVKNIIVITEWENINANNFYQKNNFTLDKIELVYHKHI